MTKSLKIMSFSMKMFDFEGSKGANTDPKASQEQFEAYKNSFALPNA